jgi:hypothetical protein
MRSRNLSAGIVRRIERELPAIARLRRDLILRRRFETFRALPQRDPGRLALDWSERSAHLDEATARSSFDRHYVYHLAWAARVAQVMRPRRHVDIASSVYFAAMISAFVEVEF